MTYNWFLNNREVIKNLKLNTGTTETPVMTALCTTSEVGLTTDFEEKDFYVFCDAIKRSVITGAKLSIETTIKIDMNNDAIVAQLGSLHTLLTSGTVAQFNNQLIEFEMIEDVTASVLTYTKYQVPVVIKISDLGGASEDEGEYACEFVINGKGVVQSA